jgi:hypothetical protein
MDDFQEFLLTVRRDINCLSDGDRAVRRGAILRLEKTLFSSGKTKPEFSRRLFLEELHKPLFRLFADQTEKCRELAITMTLRYSDLITVDDLENLLPLLLAALLGRFRALPFPEQSEELRLEALKLLGHLLNLCGEKMSPFASEIVDALSKALTDTCPDAKKECCESIKKLSGHFHADRVARAGGPLVSALLGNLKHQQWKVRRATLDCLGTLLSQEETMLEYMEEVLPHLGGLLGDRNNNVRQSLADVLEKWLLKGIGFKTPMVSNNNDDDMDGPVGFAKFESRLLLLLLSVVADEDAATVAPIAFSGLERAAVRKHEARKAAVERAREKARKMAELAKARAERGDDESAAPKFTPESEIQDPQAVRDFDYNSVASLLPDPFAAGKTTPAALTSTYVLLHLPSMLPQVLGNLTQWTADIRISAARLLRIILVSVNREIAPFLDQVLVHLYKAAADDDKDMARTVLQCATMVGAFIDIDLVLGLVGKHLGLKVDNNSNASGGGYPAKTNMDDLFPSEKKGRQVTSVVGSSEAGVKNFLAQSVENRRQVFAVLAHLLPPAHPPTKTAAPQPLKSCIPRLTQQEVRNVLKFLEDGVLSEELLPWVFEGTETLLRSGTQACVGEWPRVFDLLLRLRSGDSCDLNAVDASMDSLAELCGRTRRALYEEHLTTRLGEILLGADAELWDQASPKRHVLETLLRNAGSAGAEHIGAIVPVLARQTSPEDASMPARVDLLGLVHFLVTEEDPILTAAIKEHTPLLLDTVLIPNCTWRSGQSNNKIRKGGMICIHQLLQRHMVIPSALNAIFADLLPMLKSCLDDSFSPDNRLIACLVLSGTLSGLQSEINSEQLREVYPELLKRLDDSNDKIRTAICEALTVFFKCLPHNWSRSLYEYILKTLFVHLDDPSPDIQQGIYGALEAAIHQDYATFIQEAKLAAAKSAHPRLCEELARLATSLAQASMDADGGDVVMG